MKNNFLVGYDISDERRLAKVAKVLKEFGSRIQYSFFHCFLSDSQKERMKERHKAVIDEEEDQVVIVPVTERQLKNVESLGFKLHLEVEGVIIV
jgi:CRISPR-associated protein Cas2